MKTTPKKNGGFTLVELIVVIAILAILAAVAIPAYSGYIAKAEEANDLQLLGALNVAFNSACVENNIFNVKDSMEGAEFVLSNGLISKLKIPGGSADVPQLSNVTFNDTVAESLLESFMLYYGDNKETPFKVYVKLVFANGAFEGVEGEATVTYTYNGKEYTFSQTSVDNFKNSVYYANAEKLADNLDALSGAFGQVTLAAGSDKVEQYLGKEFADYIGDETDPTVIGNKTVLWVAEQTKNMTAQEAGQAILDAQLSLASGNFEALGDDALPSMALMYGSITAYANSVGADSAVAKKLEAGITNKTELVTLFALAVGDDAYAEYVGYDPYAATPEVTVTDSFAKDMNGYMGALDAMNTINNGNGFAGEGLLENDQLWSGTGFDDLLAGLQ